MRDNDVADGLTERSLQQWLMQCGLHGEDRETLLENYCRKLVDGGVPLVRLHVAQSSFHPRYGSLGYNWLREDGSSSEVYEYTETPTEAWLSSPLFHLLKSGKPEFRERLEDMSGDSPFPILNSLQKSGATDYFAMVIGLAPSEPGFVFDIGKEVPEGAILSWTSDREGGFSEADLSLFRSSLPILALALKSAANRQMAEDLLKVYLGRDAGRRVLSGEITRGSLQEVDAVLCYFDLKGFTQLSEQISGPDLIELLNDYFGMAVGIIQKNGGNILKFLGDGILAMFNLDGVERSTAAGLDAVAELNRAMADRNVERVARGVPTTDVTLALHSGRILYGNIGAENRLDFTVIGPAVNLTVRLSGMHRSVGRSIILSQQVAEAATGAKHDLISLGRYMLRGVGEPQELFTLYRPD